MAATRNFLVAEDVDLIRSLARVLPQQPIVIDLGAGSGTTALAVFAERPDAVVHTYDLDVNNLHWTAKAIENIGQDYRDRWYSHLGEAAHAATEWKDDSIYLVLLDASHEYEPTRDELAAWRPKLANSGVLWCHDYVGEYEGCRRAIDEAVRAGRYSMAEQRGLGVVLLPD